MNLKMADLKQCLEAAGFVNVKTLLSSGNAVFDASARSESALARKIEAAMAGHLGRRFPAIVRSTNRLQELIDADPWRGFKLPAGGKRVVTFMSEPRKTNPVLPPERDGARILAVRNGEAFSVYVPGPRGPVFMTVIEKTFGTNVTTRTWDTVKKCAAA
jgi:uncharacterized protein (DUF1697 family)